MVQIVFGGAKGNERIYGIQLRRKTYSGQFIKFIIFSNATIEKANIISPSDFNSDSGITGT